jgi:hypothetical protein
MDVNSSVLGLRYSTGNELTSDLCLISNSNFAKFGFFVDVKLNLATFKTQQI